MCVESLRKTLRRYEDISNLDPSILLERTNESELSILKKDIVRTILFVENEDGNSIMSKLYFLTLHDTFKGFSLSYYQGMLGFSITIMDAYFRNAALEFTKELTTDLDPANRISFESLTAEDYKLYSKFKLKNAELFENFRAAIINILIKYFKFFVDNNCKMYSKYGTIFLGIMKDEFGKDLNNYIKHKNLELDDSTLLLLFLKHTLILFNYSYGNYESAYKITNLILNSEPHIIFCVYFGTITHDDVGIENKGKIFNISNNDITKIINIYEKFFQYEKVKHRSCFLFFAASILIIAAAIKLYKNHKSENSEITQ